MLPTELNDRFWPRVLKKSKPTDIVQLSFLYLEYDATLIPYFPGFRIFVSKILILATFSTASATSQHGQGWPKPDQAHVIYTPRLRHPKFCI